MGILSKSGFSLTSLQIEIPDLLGQLQPRSPGETPVQEEEVVEMLTDMSDLEEYLRPQLSLEYGRLSRYLLGLSLGELLGKVLPAQVPLLPEDSLRSARVVWHRRLPSAYVGVVPETAGR